MVICNHALLLIYIFVSTSYVSKRVTQKVCRFDGIFESDLKYYVFIGI